MSNPFETNTEGPRYGNAYENTPTSPPPTLGMGSPALPPRNNITNSPYGTQRMPSPSDYHQPPPPPGMNNNAWQESNKTLEEDRMSPQPQNAYQYTGTQYGNTSATENAYSPHPVHNTAAVNEQSHKIETPMTVSDNEATYNTNNKAGLPSKLRLLIRFILLVAGIGHLGFAAGASPYSGEPVPFETACFYFLFAVAICSIIYSTYHIIFFFVRRFGKAEKMKRTILVLCDLLMALLWGIGIIVEIAKFNCPPGGHNGWCNFYNTSIFFGFISFVLYIITLGWDIVGACKNRKK